MTKPIITQEFVKRHLHYDATTGEFTRVKRGKGCRIGKSGWIDSRGYVKLGLNSTDYLAHRIAWLYVYGEIPDCQIDHINHIRDDNRIENLSLATHRDNGRNQKRHSTNTSGLGGVGFRNGIAKWVATIRIGDSTHHLGAYDEWWDAVCARKSANNKHGFHVNHGV